jgi:hypothetical protein
MAFKPKTEHELDWSDKELAYMAKRMQRSDGTISNLATLYRLMGYEGERPSEAFKKRVGRLTNTNH